MRATTILLIALFLLMVKLATAQVIIKEWKRYSSTISSGGLQTITTGTLSRAVQYDTTKSILAVSIDEIEFDKGTFYTMPGYEVIKYDGYDIEWFYLDKNKKPLQQGIIVWMSKESKR